METAVHGTLKTYDFESLMSFRIRKILMICSNYDAFILEEDGQIEAQIRQEYIELNLTNPPQFIWVSTSDEARKMIENDHTIDMVISMYNLTDKDIFSFATYVKSLSRNIPFVLLTHYSKEVQRQLAYQDTSAVDYSFTWHGNADLILAIVKLFEDMQNADNDILGIGVQAILLVEDNSRYYSTYLPELYRLILTQSAEFLKETLNEQQRKYIKRSRPKILLATNYEDAMDFYEKYRRNLLGVISDVGFVMHRNDPLELEKLDAGIRLVKAIKADNPQLPVLMQSSQESVGAIASELGVGFLRKYSKTLFLQLADYIKAELCFGDFVFRDTEGVEYGRASNLTELEACVNRIPSDVLRYNTSRNMLSKWLFARGLFAIANQFESVQDSTFSSHDELRDYVSKSIHDFHLLTGRGVVAHFDQETYAPYVWFARMGEGSLGGKARGLAFLNSLIYKHSLASKYDNLRISIPRTIVVSADYFDEFIVENGLQYVIDSEIPDEEILSEFVSSRLPSRLVEDLKIFVSTVRSPLAIRSSSKLEDSNYQPFAGVYSTYMIPLVENKDQMRRMLEKAIKSVYASVFFNGSRNYIQTTANLLSEEKMAVVVQSICGSYHGGYYYPMLSGVARSVNFYPIGNEKPEDGIVNVAYGLGKSVVDGGHTLRFDPKFPKKILQLSEPKIALRDTQKMMYALDLRPGSFKTSKDDSINLAHIPVVDTIEGYEYPGYVFSTFSLQDSRIVPGVTANGPRIVSFDTILKYGKVQLAKVLSDVLDICKKELMCDVEMEFAMDVVPNTDGRDFVLKLLQVRPISEYFDEQDSSIENVSDEITTRLLMSNKALGSGRSSKMHHIVYVAPSSFDSAKTKEIAASIADINLRMKEADETYTLIGPGRWGSSDPWLGIPVAWNDISQARMIVECAIPGFQIEPSQGTHFFQNITSLGVGYLTIDTVHKDGDIDFGAIEGLTCVEKNEYVSVFRTDTPLIGYIDRSTNKAILGY